MKNFEFKNGYIALNKCYELMKNGAVLDEKEGDCMYKIIHLCKSILSDFPYSEYELKYLEIEDHNRIIINEIEEMKKKMR